MECQPDSVNVWSCPSFTELRCDGYDVERWSCLHPENKTRATYVWICLSSVGRSLRIDLSKKSLKERTFASS